MFFPGINMLGNKTKIIESNIIGDVFSGDKISIYNNCKLEINDIENEIVNFDEKLKEDLKKVVKNAQTSVSNFESLNPGLKLNMGISDEIVEYVISSEGTQSITIGSLTINSNAIDKYKYFIEYGESVEFSKDEYSFNTTLKGLPEYAEDLKEKLFLDAHHKPVSHTVQLNSYSNNSQTVFSLITKLTILSYGNRYGKFQISDLEFTGLITFTFDFQNGLILDLEIHVKYISDSINNCIKTTDFFISLTSNVFLDILYIEKDITFFKIHVTNFKTEKNLETMKKFLLSCKNVFQHFSIPQILIDSLSEQEILYIQLVDSFINKRNITLKNYYLRINSDDESLYKEIQKNGNKLNLTVNISLEFIINNVKIMLGSHDVIIQKLALVTDPDSNEQVIKSGSMIYIFNKI